MLALNRYLRLYGLFLRQRLKILMEYRVNFFIGAVSTVIYQAASLLTLWVVMQQVPTLTDRNQQVWPFEAVLVMYGLVTLGQSLNHMLADNLWTIGWNYIRTGLFDQFLIRPVNPLFHLLADRFCHDGIGHFLVGLTLVVTGINGMGLVWGPFLVLYVAVMALSTGLIFFALNLITASSAFFIIQSIPITQMVFNMHEFARYPLSMYHAGLQWVLTLVIPYGIATFYPVSYLLGRESGIWAWAAPLVAVAFVALAYQAWRFGLRHYASAGS